VIGRLLRSARLRLSAASAILFAPPSGPLLETAAPPVVEPVRPEPKVPLQEFSSDGYLLWLVFANAGMLEHGNLRAFEHAVAERPSDAPFVEIGTFCGLSANAIGYFKRKHGARNRLITADRWMFEGAEPGSLLGDPTLSYDEYRDFVKETCRRNLLMFSRGDLPYPVEMLSDELFAAWSESRRVDDLFGRAVTLGGPISFCYIDGNHTYDYARRDFDHADAFLEPGGFILFDDSADGSGWEVCKVVEEVQASGRYDLVMKNPNYFFRKK
jgi:hypothetical protein